MATFQVPWNLHTHSTWRGVEDSNVTTSGTLPNAVRDERPLVRRTPRAKWRPPTPYYRVVWSGDNDEYRATVSWKYHDPRNPPNCYAWIDRSGANNASGYYSTPMPAPPSNLESRAIIKARLKLKQMKINLPQVYAERNQTVRLVGENLRKLILMVEDVKRLKPGRFIRKELRPEWLFNQWLEIQYGWKPLLSDVHGACQHLAEQELRADWPPCVVKAVVREKGRVVTPLSDSVNILVYNLEKIDDFTHKAMIRLDFEPDLAPQGLATQLGITNPLELAWELLPWSFVADWFIPVGDYLSSLDATVGWRFKGGSYSVKTEALSRARLVNVVPDPYVVSDIGPFVSMEGSGRRMQFTRTTYADAPLPTMPSLAKWDKSSVLHVANGIALLHNAIAGGTRVR